MTDAIDNHVSVDISIESATVPRAGFGTMMIASHNATWPERVRTYASTAGVLEDWPSDSPEGRIAARIFSQTPRPERIKIGRVASPVTMQYTVKASAVVSLDRYTLGVVGEGFESFDAEYVSDGTATTAEIHRGLVNALNSGFLETLTFADKTVSAVDQADNELDFAAPHGLSTGDGPIRLTNTGGALPAGLALATDYFVIAVDADSISLATSRDNALEGVEVDITGAGSGTHFVVDTADTKHVDNNYTAAYGALTVADFTFTATNATETFTKVAHGLNTGDGPVQVSNSGGALPAGLAALTDYWVIKLTDDTFQLATSFQNAMAGTPLGITTDGTGTQTLDVLAGSKSPTAPFTVTGDASGEWFSLDIPDAQLSRLSLSMTHAAGTLDEDLAAILNEDKEWYLLLTLYNSKAYVLEAAAWVEANGRTYAVDVPDTEAVTTPVFGATDTLAALLALSYARTMYSFHPNPSAFFSGAWMGRWLPTLPGKATPKFKTLQGVEVVTLTETQRANLTNRRGNSYELAGARNIAFEGTVGNTTFAFFDVTRNRDWLADEVKKSAFGVLVGADIVPFTAEGTAMVYGGVRGSIFGIAQEQGVLAKDPEPVVNAPKISEILAADKAARKLRTITFNATLQGAVHSVAVVGTVTF